MKGPHDDELIWPLRGTFELKLLNQISNCEHHFKTVSFYDSITDLAAGRVTNGDSACRVQGSGQFISRKDLFKVTSTSRYLKDDYIFFQVTMQ